MTYGQTSKSPKEKTTTSFKVIKMAQPSEELVPYPTPDGQPIWVHPDLLEDGNWEIVKTKPTARQRRQAKRQLRKLKQQEKAQPKQEVSEKADTSSTASLGATEEPLPKTSKAARRFTLGDFMPPQLRNEATQGTSYSCNSVVGFSMNGYESSDTASDTDEWEESLETGEYLSDEEWVPESQLMPVIWYNPLQPQGSWSDAEEDQEAVQENAVDPAPANAPVEPNIDEPQGADDEEEDLAPMPDLEEYAMILRRLAIEQEQDHLNLQASPPVTPENEESCWIDDPLTSEDESEFQQSALGASSIGVACNAIVQDDDAFETSSAEATDSQTASGSISSGATSSRVTSAEISPSQASSFETVTSELKPLPTGQIEESPADIVFFNENPVNWSQVPDLIGDIWTDEILDKEGKLLEAVQDLFPENASCNAIVEDANAVTETSSENEKDQPLDPEGDLPNEEPSLEALEVGRGTRSGRDYHKNYNQPSSSYVNPSGKQVVNAPSGKNNENAGPKEAFKYDLIQHFKHIPARLHILDLLRMSP